MVSFSSRSEMTVFFELLTLAVHLHHQAEVCLGNARCGDLNSACEFDNDFPLDLGQLIKKVYWHTAKRT